MADHDGTQSQAVTPESTLPKDVDQMEVVKTEEDNGVEHDKAEETATSPTKTENENAGEGEVEGEADAEGSDHDVPVDNDEEMLDAPEEDDGRLPNTLYKAYKAITEVLLNFKLKTKSNEEHYPSNIFKRLPNKRLLPTYYEVIKEPSAISTLRGKIQRKQYSGTPEFVRDFALISHNAQVFNRPNSQPVRDVLKLEELFKDELKKLVEEGLATEEEIKFPDLGEIPQATPEPDPVSEDESDEPDEDDEEDEEEEADESDDDKRTRRGRKAKSAVGKRAADEAEDEKGADAEQKRRGRPPKVATPMEHRIDKILKSLKKVKNAEGQQMMGPFERLPDTTEFPDYYDVIKQPMAFDVLKKKAKRKKYTSIEDFMKDVELMFKNAMTYNEDGSDVYNYAIQLLQEAKKFEAEERAKPDSEYLQAADGRIPVPFITYKGDTWKVGDWVHIQNPNDVTKPIVAQIYRTWKTASDEEWINACWYYRPEQTVHQFEKHFYPGEVVKTGQYRDHKIEEALNKCFVMFYTRYSRGRPRNLPADAEVYVCEARYNEEKFKFNKIKTWASCLPDEVRDKDYEMDLFEGPRRIKKIPSPLLDQLKSDAKATDDMPQPEWKHPNAPPLMGGIHRRARDENQSPPPEPTPPPQALPSTIARTPSVGQQGNMRVQNYGLNRSASDAAQPLGGRQAPSLTSQTSYGTNTPVSRQQSYQGNAYAASTPAPNQQGPVQNVQWARQHQQTSMVAAHPSAYNAQQTPYNRAPVPYPQSGQMQTASAVLHQQRQPEAYVLSEAANASLPQEIRDQFPTDEQGNVIFFTSPPNVSQPDIIDIKQFEIVEPLKHSDAYKQASLARKRKLLSENVHRRTNGKTNYGNIESGASAVTVDQGDHASGSAIVRSAIDVLTQQINSRTILEYKERFGDQWAQIIEQDKVWSQKRRHLEEDKVAVAEKRRKIMRSAHLGRYNGQYEINSSGFITGWQKGFFTGVYLDDRDSRLPF